MPTYDYRCAKGHVFELFHSIKDDSPKRCPRCKSRAKRIPAGGGGLLFKGSGFYITDYRSKSYKEGAKAERPADKGSGGEKGGKSGKVGPGEKSSKGEAGPKKSSGD